MDEDAERYCFSDFTRSHYRELLRLAKARYTFRSFTDFHPTERFALWRHDIDYSPHCARKLARIEVEEGVTSTFFLHLHNEFYNLLERGVSDVVRDIQEMGHTLGLHFDSHYYASDDAGEIERLLEFERGILERLFTTSIEVFSFHNSTPFTMGFTRSSYAGMVHVHARYFQEEVGYVSDSNGYWRFKRLKDVLTAPEHERLQVLTHPAWWQDEPMPPRQRILRCVEGRAERTMETYDNALRLYGRMNIAG